MSTEPDLMEKIVSLCKRRGFIFPGSEIYGGYAGFWDYGPYGVELKNNLKQLWWRTFVQERDDMVGLDAAIIMQPRAWEASGHVEGFSDPVAVCKNCGHKVRADQHTTPGMSFSKSLLYQNLQPCPECGKNDWSPLSNFNLMFQTKVGASDDSSAVSYLRPETAGGIFLNFKNVIDSIHPKLPFGIAQIGKAFRNEIAPRDFIFRAREFEQMEIEYFVRESEWRQYFDEWQKLQLEFARAIGLKDNRLHQIEVPAEDRAHYSKHSVDTEFDFPFGQKELWGLAYRTNFDLSAHEKASGQNLGMMDKEGEPAVVPHVVEPTFGLDRTMLAVLTSAYTEDDLGGEKRVYLKFPRAIAPIKAAVFPLLKNKPELVAKAREIYAMLKKETPQVMWDDNGNIGKRYRRQDEIGTPSCITVDFQTLEDQTVTVRNRDSGEQSRVATAELVRSI